MSLQPYQKASEEMVRQANAPAKLVKNAASIGLGVAGGSAVVGRILPFLNKFIPTEMAVKGISKIDKRLGKFLSASISQGYPVEEVMDFVKEKITPKETKTTQKQVDEKELARQKALQGFKQKIKQPNLQEQEMQRFQSQYGQNQQQQSGGSQTKDQLLTAMQQLTQTLKG